MFQAVEEPGNSEIQTDYIQSVKSFRPLRAPPPRTFQSFPVLCVKALCTRSSPRLAMMSFHWNIRARRNCPPTRVYHMLLITSGLLPRKYFQTLLPFVFVLKVVCDPFKFLQIRRIRYQCHCFHTINWRANSINHQLAGRRWRWRSYGRKKRQETVKTKALLWSMNCEKHVIYTLVGI